VTIAPVVRAVLTAALLTASASCNRPAEKARKAAQTLRSWDATLALLEAEAARNAVPQQYVGQLRRAAGEERSRALARLRESGGP
jgi:hypothetical protein